MAWEREQNMTVADYLEIEESDPGCISKGIPMKLNHLNLTVTDVTAAAHFLETYFGLRNQGGNKGLTILFDDNGLVLTLMKAGQVTYPGTFHIGFFQESKQQVNEIYQRLKDDGFEVEPPQQSHAWTFYMQAPGGFTVEIAASLRE